MSSILKVNTIQDTDGNNIINENANVITIGASGDTITVPAGATLSGDLTGITNLTMTGDLTVDNTTGAELILFRNDTSIAVDDLIGGIQFKANDASSSPDPQICGIKAISTGATNTNPKLSFFAGESNYNANTPNMSIDSGGNITMSSDLTVDTNTLFVDASENTVVIGGTDATSWNANADELVVAGASAGGMTFYNPTQTNIFFADGTTGDDVSRGRIQYVHSGDSLIFGTDATERARIDSSGNLLVNKTSSDGGVVGVELLSSGAVFATRNNNFPLFLNRTGSDGNIALFRKDGTNVGSIGNISADFYITNSTATNGAGINLQNNLFVTPMKGGSRDTGSNVSLGNSTYTWKDLYLGGGLYVGGTGSANKLDDYEEGTFTPSWTSGISSASYSTQLGKYTKIGNIVYIAIQITTTAASATSSRLKLGGLPFTAQSTSNGAGVIGYVDNDLIASKSNNLPTFFVEPTALETYFTDGTQFLGTDVSNVASLNLHVTATYITDA